VTQKSGARVSANMLSVKHDTCENAKYAMRNGRSLSQQMSEQTLSLCLIFSQNFSKSETQSKIGYHRAVPFLCFNWKYPES